MFTDKLCYFTFITLLVKSVLTLSRKCRSKRLFYGVLHLQNDTACVNLGLFYHSFLFHTGSPIGESQSFLNHFQFNSYWLLTLLICSITSHLMLCSIFSTGYICATFFLCFLLFTGILETQVFSGIP